MKPKLYIVTGSPFKFKELSSRLSEFFICEQKPWDEPEIQGKPEEILKHKMLRAYDIYKYPVLVDDSSAHFEELNGFPGPYMKDFFDVMSPYEIGHKFADSRIKAVCWIGLCFNQDDLLITQGEFNGTIVAPKDEDHQNRWYDLFVKLDGMDKVLIDCTIEEKNAFSHRGKAMDALLEKLKERK